MKCTVATAMFALALLVVAPPAQAASGWWTGTIRTMYTHERGHLKLYVVAPKPQEKGIRCGVPDDIKLLRFSGDDATSKFEVMYDNLARALSEGRRVSLYLQERTYSNGNTYCLVLNVGRWSS